MVALDHEFHGIAQGRQLLDPEPGPADEPHLQQSLADLAMSLHLDHLPLVPRLELTQGDR